MCVCVRGGGGGGGVEEERERRRGRRRGSGRGRGAVSRWSVQTLSPPSPSRAIGSNQSLPSRSPVSDSRGSKEASASGKIQKGKDSIRGVKPTKVPAPFSMSVGQFLGLKRYPFHFPSVTFQSIEIALHVCTLPLIPLRFLGLSACGR